jgi:ribosomal protein L33
LLSGKLPEWPYRWPMVGHDRLQVRVGRDIAEILRCAIQLDPADRYKSAIQMYAAFQLVRSRAGRKQRGPRKADRKGRSWRRMQWREFQRLYKSQLQTRYHCRRCEGPVAESMQACPWCGTDNPARDAISDMPAHCPRCERGVKLDWTYCAWCFGPGFEVETTRRYSDKRYVALCANHRCKQPLMAFMKYCPWCKAKVKKPWKLVGSTHKCRSCKCGIAGDFWNFCAWCKKPLRRHSSSR